MIVRSEMKNNFLVFYLDESIYANTDISAICSKIENAIDDGHKHIAVTFPDNSHLSSRAIYVLLKCNEITRSREGTFQFIQPNKNIARMFETLGLDKVIDSVGNEDGLISKGPA